MISTIWRHGCISNSLENKIKAIIMYLHLRLTLFGKECGGISENHIRRT